VSAPGVGSVFVTVTEAGVTTGLVMMLVGQAAALQPGVLTSVYVALFEITRRWRRPSRG